MSAALRDWATRQGLSRSHATSDPVAWLLGQPYQLDSDDLHDLARLRELGLTACVSTFPSWQHPGETLAVLVTREAGS